MRIIDLKLKYTEFFGTGLWEKEYEPHIVEFARQCCVKQERKTLELILNVIEDDSNIQVKDIQDYIESKLSQI